MEKILWMIIDMQNDFCSPSGALYVPGAEKDAERVAWLMEAWQSRIAAVLLTRDEHQVMDIAHPVFWKNPEGYAPPVFTRITAAEVRQDKWRPRREKVLVLDYLQQLEARGGGLTIWPEHCIVGSEGAAIFPVVMEAVQKWCRTGKYVNMLTKGTYPLAEHYGAFQAEVPRPEVPETQLNLFWLQKLKAYDRIWVAGEARSHCVARTLGQLLDFPDIVRKLVILSDCMSPVAGDEEKTCRLFGLLTDRGATLTTAAGLVA